MRRRPKRRANASSVLGALLGPTESRDRRPPGEDQEGEAADHERDREVVEGSPTPKASLVTSPVWLLADQARDRVLGGRAGMADVENQAAVDDVGVGEMTR